MKLYWIILLIALGCTRAPQPAAKYTQLKRDLLELQQASILSRHSDIGLAAPNEFFEAIRQLQNDYRLQIPKPGTNACYRLQLAINNANELGVAARPANPVRLIEGSQYILLHSTEDAIRALEAEELPQP